MRANKANLTLPSGATMIGAVISALERVCESVVIVGSSVEGHKTVVDRRPGTGPLAGIEALLASGIDGQYLVCPNDMPMITSDLLQRLAKQTDSVATILEIEGDGKVQTLPMRISTHALDVITDALDAGSNAIHQVLNLIDVERVPITIQEAEALRNINTPRDYEALD